MHRIRIATAVALIVGLSSVAAAQGTDSTRHDEGMRHGMMGATREARQGRMMGQLMRGIELTDAQRTQLRTIRDRYRTQRESLMPAGGMAEGQRPDTAARRQMMSLMQQERADMRAVLTPDQQATFDRNVATMRDEMNERRGERRGEGRGGRRGMGRGRGAGDDSTRAP